MLPQTFTQELIRQIEIMRLKSRKKFLGTKQGGHISLKRGHGIEFSDYRQYEPGDNPRDIDWAVYARSERLYVKRFQEEQNLSVSIILDGSSSMTIPSYDRKWERAIEMAVVIAYIALMAHDTVSFSILGNYFSPHYKGAKSFAAISKDLMSAPTGGTFDIRREMSLVLSRIKFPGVCFFISDFLMAYEDIVHCLGLTLSKNLDTAVLPILSPRDMNPFLDVARSAIFVDSETEEEIRVERSVNFDSEYSTVLDKHLADIAEYCHSRGISFVPSSSDSDLAWFVTSELPKTGLFR